MLTHMIPQTYELGPVRIVISYMRAEPQKSTLESDESTFKAEESRSEVQALSQGSTNAFCLL